MDAVKTKTVLCTSCKSTEKAISRCADCANFLCSNCNSAHEVMRCFENHHVYTLEDLRKSSKLIPIHKPVLCNIHPTEQVKFFCLQCQVCLYFSVMMLTMQQCIIKLNIIYDM